MTKLWREQGLRRVQRGTQHFLGGVANSVQWVEQNWRQEVEWEVVSRFRVVDSSLMAGSSRRRRIQLLR